MCLKCGSRNSNLLNLTRNSMKRIPHCGYPYRSLTIRRLKYMKPDKAVMWHIGHATTDFDVVWGVRTSSVPCYKIFRKKWWATKPVLSFETSIMFWYIQTDLDRVWCMSGDQCNELRTPPPRTFLLDVSPAGHFTFPLLVGQIPRTIPPPISFVFKYDGH
jgi:hypothetical protein